VMKRGLPFYAISSASGEGITPLVRAMADALDKIPKPEWAAGPSGSEHDAGTSLAAPASIPEEK
jgi:hypothetical protein